MELTYEQLVKALGGEVIVDNGCHDFTEACIDNRKITKNCIFFAIKGERFNANDVAVEALEKGASIAVVDEVNFDIKDAEGKGVIIKVDKTVKALMRLANFYRNSLDIKVIGVTGSTGKTSTKDLIAALLSEKYKVFKTKGNFNSEIGLPLMILQMDKSYDIAVLEMGMSDLGEIRNLAETARPDMAAITNIGLSHLENLKTQENILKAKMEIVEFFGSDNVLVVNGEDDKLKNIESTSYKVKKIGYNHEYDVYASNIILREDETEFTAHLGSREKTFKLPMAGKHNVLNGMLAIALADGLGVTLDQMAAGVKNLEATSMRLQVIKKDNITIINDCYNASPDSMKSSLDVLNTYTEGRKVAILGDMYELGTKSSEAHTEIGAYAGTKSDLLVAVGENIENFAAGFGGNEIKTYKTKQECIDDLKNVISKGDIVLVKASRGMKFEDIVDALNKI